MGIFTRSRKTTAVARPASPADALFTEVQQRVLGVLFGNPDRSFHLDEIVAAGEADVDGVTAELARLEAGQLIIAKRVGSQKHFQANADAPVFEELRTLVFKTTGLSGVLRVALAPKASKIRAAFVYGAALKNQDSATTDIDMIVISDSLIYNDLIALVKSASSVLDRTINPTVYSTRELTRRLRVKNAFLLRVLAQPKIWLIGAQRSLTG